MKIKIFILLLFINCKQIENKNLFVEDSKMNQISNLSEFVFPRRNSASESDIQESKKIFKQANEIHRKMKESLNSIPIYIQAIEIYPDPEYYFELGNVLIDQKKYKSSILLFETATELNPENLGKIYYNAARSASLDKNSEQAIKFLEKALINNYSNFKHIKEDNDLDFIKSEDEFISLIKKYETNLSEKERLLIGIWQDSPVMTSGWSDTLSFFPDRTLIQRFNTMDCAKRLISKTGSWKLIQNQLIIQFYKKEHIIAGKFITATGSCASEKELINGKIIQSKIKPVQILKKKISEIKKDDLLEIGREDYNLTIDEIRYWKLRNNPEDYE